MAIEVSRIPLSVDVWNEIEAVLHTGFKNLSELSLCYSAKNHSATIVLKAHSTPPATRIIVLDTNKSEELIMALAERFNFPWQALHELTFTIKPDIVPIFSVKYYPYFSESPPFTEFKAAMLQ